MIDLHHAGIKPDWHDVRPEDRNIWQKAAARTKGIVTPGNIASLAGLGLVIWGFIDLIEGNVGAGLLKIAVGRIMDLVDGAVAHATGTKNLLSEAVDAAVDKIELFIGLPVLMHQGILPLLAGIVIGLQNFANIIPAVVAKKKGRELRPSMWGKFATAAQWSAIILYLAAAVSEGANEAATQLLDISGHMMMVVLFVPMGIVATVGYLRDAFPKS